MGKILKTDKCVKDGKIILTQKVEEAFDRSAIMSKIHEHQKNKLVISEKVKELKTMYDNETKLEQEWADMLEMIPEEEPTIIE